MPTVLAERFAIRPRDAVAAAGQRGIGYLCVTELCMSDEVAELRALGVRLKSGEYDGADVMAAWIAVQEYANLLERNAKHQSPCRPAFDGEKGTCLTCGATFKCGAAGDIAQQTPSLEHYRRAVSSVFIVGDETLRRVDEIAQQYAEAQRLAVNQSG